MLEKDELIQKLWPDSFVEEANVAINISQLRKALGERPEGGQYIETVPRRGCRFVAGVREVLDERPDLIVREYTNAEVLIEEEALSQSEAEQASEQKALIANSEVALSAAPPTGSMSGRFVGGVKQRQRIGIVLALVVAVDCIVFNPNGIRRTSDGRALIYRDKGSGVWSQSLDGSPPKRLGDFQSDLIFDLAWSRDGKKLAVARGAVTSDVVLVTGFR